MDVAWRGAIETRKWDEGEKRRESELKGREKNKIIYSFFFFFLGLERWWEW